MWKRITSIWIIGIFLLILPLVFGASTNLILQDADTEILNDAYVDESLADSNLGSETTIRVRDNSSGSARRSFVMFNISGISSGFIVNEAYFRWTTTVFEAIGRPRAFEVNTTWNEMEITWNNQMDGSLWDDAKMNTSLAESNSSGTGLGNHTFNVTNMVRRAISESRGNITIMIITTSGGAGLEALANSKESGKDTSEFPMLNVTFTEISLPATEKYIINAKDFLNLPIVNLTVNITNGSNLDEFNVILSTVNGTINIDNRTVEAFGKDFYTFLIMANDSGGWFNATIQNVNITDGGITTAEMFQSVLRVTAFDAFDNSTISSFSATTNFSASEGSGSTTNGELLLLMNLGNYSLTVSASGFEDTNIDFHRLALDNTTLNVSMGSTFSFSLFREETGLPFNTNATNQTKLEIVCPQETIRVIFNNVSNISKIINCQFTLMQIVVDYGTQGSYFRTLIPDFTQRQIDWYLIDLNLGDIVIQRIISLLDLTKEFVSAKLTVKRAVNGTTKNVIEQRFDASDEVNLFLVKNGLYTMEIDNGVQTILLGNLIPTEAGTQTITLPAIEFVPQETILGGNVTFSYTFNATQGILRMQYLDTSNKTTLIRFTVFENSTMQVFSGESLNNASAIITFNQVVGNITYNTELFVQHQDFINFTDKKVFFQLTGTSSGALDLEGWTPAEQRDLKKWFAFIFLAIWGLMFSRLHAGIGMTTLIIWLWIFRIFEWVEVSGLIFGFLALLAVIGWVVEAMRKN